MINDIEHFNMPLSIYIFSFLFTLFLGLMGLVIKFLWSSSSASYKLGINSLLDMCGKKFFFNLRLFLYLK